MMTRALRNLVFPILMVLGCRSPAADLSDRAITLIEGGVVVLESQVQTPEQAPAAFRAYMDENQGEVETMEELRHALGPSMSERDIATIRRRFLEGISPLEDRLKALSDHYRKFPKVLSALGELEPPELR